MSIRPNRGAPNPARGGDGRRRRWSESPVPRPGVRRVRAAGVPLVPLAITKARYGGYVENAASGTDMVLTADWSETAAEAIDYLRSYYSGNLHVVFQATWFASSVAGQFNAYNQIQTAGTGTHDAVGLATVPTFPSCTLIAATAAAAVALPVGTASLRHGLWWANAADLGAPGAETIDLSSLAGVSAHVIVTATISDATQFVLNDLVEYGAGATNTIPALPGDYAAGILEPQLGTYFTGSTVTPDAATSDSYVYTSSYTAAEFGYIRAVAVA